MTKSKFDTAYNKWLQQVDVGEDDAVWNEIQDELDFNETWDNISARLDEVKPQRGRVIPMMYLKIIAAAAAILLMLFLPVRYLVERANPPAIVSELSGVTDEKEDITSDELTLLSDELTLLEAEKIDETKVVHGVAPLAPPASIIVDKSLPSYSSNDALALSKIHSLPLDASVLLTSSDATLSNLKETEFSISPEYEQYPGFSVRVVEVGLVYGYKNTWLLNHETRNGLNPGKLGNTLPTFHQDIGGSTSLIVNNQHLIGLEFLWKSEAGQKYQQYINASYVERNIMLDYLKLQAFYFWEHDGFPGQAIVGGYVGRLTAAEELVDKTRLNVGDSYSNLDFGLLAGYQVNIALNKRFIVKPGLRVSYNLVNIFEGNDITPSYYKRTNNLSASFNISLSYGLNK